MALLLRMGGVPARVATGFSPGGFSKRRDAWIVRDTDAHAWVEAWFDDLGWVTYDPTPDATPARSQIAALEAAPAAGGRRPGGDPARCAGVGGRRSRRLGGVRPDLLFDPQRNNPGGAPPPTPAAGRRGGSGRWLAARGARRARRSGRSYVLRAARPRAAVAARPRGVRSSRLALRRAGRPLETGTTLRQLEQRFGASAEATAYLRALSASRYGPTPRLPDGARERRVAAARARAGPRLGRAPARVLGAAAAPLRTARGRARRARRASAPRARLRAATQLSAARRSCSRISERIRSSRGSDERST